MTPTEQTDSGGRFVGAATHTFKWPTPGAPTPRARARVIVELEVDLATAFAENADAGDVMEWTQSLVGNQICHEETDAGEITGLSILSCHLMRDGRRS